MPALRASDSNTASAALARASARSRSTSNTAAAAAAPSTARPILVLSRPTEMASRCAEWFIATEIAASMTGRTGRSEGIWTRRSFNMAALYAGLHGAADAFAIAIKCRNEKSDLIHLKSSGYAAIRISLRPIDLHQRSKLAERDKGPEKPLLRKPHWGDSRDGHQDLSCGSDRGHRSP